MTGPPREADLLARLAHADRAGDGSVGAALAELARFLRDEGRTDEAVLHARRRVDIEGTATPPAPARLADAALFLGTLLLQQGRFDESSPFLQKALDLRQKEFGKRDPRVAEVLTAQGRWMQAAGRPEEADAAFIRAIEVLQDHGPDAARLLADAVEGRAALLQSTGQVTDLAQARERATEVRHRAEPAGEPRPAAGGRAAADKGGCGGAVLFWILAAGAAAGLGGLA